MRTIIAIDPGKSGAFAVSAGEQCPKAVGEIAES